MDIETLTSALGIATDDVVAVVGAGGKTTLLARLAEEAAAEGRAAVVTSTTRFTLPPISGAELAVFDTRSGLARACSTAAGRGRAVIAATAASDRTRFVGVPPAWVADIADSRGVALTLVNADGARMRPFKAPGPHEPVIPDRATLVVAVAGLDAIGRPLDERWVHRPEVVSALAGLPLGAPVDETTMVRVLASVEGGRKGLPPGVRYAVVLTKAETPERAAAGHRIATALVAAAVPRVVVVSLHRPQRVVEVVPQHRSDSIRACRPRPHGG